MRPVAAIIKTVGEFYQISELDIRSKRRDAETVWARQVAMWLAKETTTHSLPQLGQAIGGRDHTTVMHALRRIERLRETDETVRADTDALLIAVRGQSFQGAADCVVVELAQRLVALPPSMRAANGFQLGLLSEEILRLHGREQTPSNMEKTNVGND